MVRKDDAVETLIDCPMFREARYVNRSPSLDFNTPKTFYVDPQAQTTSGKLFKDIKNGKLSLLLTSRPVWNKKNHQNGNLFACAIMTV